jgi:hypothetical protein
MFGHVWPCKEIVAAALAKPLRLDFEQAEIILPPCPTRKSGQSEAKFPNHPLVGGFAGGHG